MDPITLIVVGVVAVMLLRQNATTSAALGPSAASAGQGQTSALAALAKALAPGKASGGGASGGGTGGGSGGGTGGGSGAGYGAISATSSYRGGPVTSANLGSFLQGQKDYVAANPSQLEQDNSLQDTYLQTDPGSTYSTPAVSWPDYSIATQDAATSTDLIAVSADPVYSTPVVDWPTVDNGADLSSGTDNSGSDYSGDY